METLSKKFITDANGKKISVILSFKKYKKLMEDIHDLAVIAERRSEKSVPLDEMRKKLKKDGLI